MKSWGQKEEKLVSRVECLSPDSPVLFLTVTV